MERKSRYIEESKAPEALMSNIPCKAGSTYGDTVQYDDILLCGLDNMFKLQSLAVYNNGQLIFGIKAEYIDLRSGKIVSSGTHVNTWSNIVATKSVLTLDENEYIVKFEGRSGGFIDKISLTLSSGRVWTVGGEGGRPFSFVAPEGKHFSGFNAGTGGHLHNISMRLFNFPPKWFKFTREREEGDWGVELDNIKGENSNLLYSEGY